MNDLINQLGRAVDLGYATHEEAMAVGRKALGLHGLVKPESGIAAPAEEASVEAPETPAEPTAEGEAQPEATPEAPAEQPAQ